MKGITPVVAVILLLLITISMVGFAFVWFTRFLGSTTGALENKTQALVLTKSVRLENVKGTTVDLRNTGDATISNTELAFYVNDARTSTTCPATIAPGAIVTCTLASACPVNGRLRVTVPGGEDTDICK